MSAVRCIIQQLGDELIRRLDSTGAAPDSMQVCWPVVIAAHVFTYMIAHIHTGRHVAMPLVEKVPCVAKGNHVARFSVTDSTHALQLPAGLGVALLLSPQAAATAPRPHTGRDPGDLAVIEIAMRTDPDIALVDDYIDGDAVANADESDNIPTAGDASCSSGPSWSAVWGRDEELFGPDLSTFEVPCDGHSCVGLEVGERPQHSAIMSVFSTTNCRSGESAACGDASELTCSS